MPQIVTEKEQRDPQTYAIIGAAMRVHKELGAGFLEAVYQEALAIELDESHVQLEREKLLEVSYKGRVLRCGYKADFVCFNEVLVELKALSNLTNDHCAQVINYLKITKLRKALLINFGSQSLEFKRFVN